MTLKSININGKIHYGINLNVSGLSVISYVDIGAAESDETIEIDFSYLELKKSILNSSIIPSSDKYVSHEESIEKGEYLLPDDENTAALLKEVDALKEFAEYLQKELRERVKK